MNIWIELKEVIYYRITVLPAKLSAWHRRRSRLMHLHVCQNEFVCKSNQQHGCDKGHLTTHRSSTISILSLWFGVIITSGSYSCLRIFLILNTFGSHLPTSLCTKEKLTTSYFALMLFFLILFHQLRPCWLEVVLIFTSPICLVVYFILNYKWLQQCL
jgi:hypothetical protein